MKNGILLVFGLSAVLLSLLYFFLGWPHRWWEFAVLIVIVVVSALILLNVITAIMEAAALELDRTTQADLRQFFVSALAGGLQVTSSPLQTRPSHLHVAATLEAQDRGTLHRPFPASSDAPAWDDFLRTLRGAASYKTAVPFLPTWVRVFDYKGQLLIKLPVERKPCSGDTVILEFGVGMSSGLMPARPPLVLGTAASVEHDDSGEVSVRLTRESVVRALGPEVELDQ